jgi:hypothetical protein
MNLGAYVFPYYMSDGSSSGMTTSTTDDISPTLIDMGANDYDGVLFIGVPNLVTAAGVLQLNPMFGDTSGTMTASTVFVGSTSTIASTGVAGSSGQVPVMVDVYRPPHRWVGLTVHRASQNSRCTVIGLAYRGSRLPAPGTTTPLGFNTALTTGSTALFGLKIMGGTTTT